MAEVKVNTKNIQQDQQQSQSREGGQERTGLARRDASSLWGFPNLFNANPLTMMRRFSEEMERAFSGGSWSEFGAGQLAVWSPAIEVTSADGKMVVRADLPGLNKDEVKVQVDNDGLTIQ